MSLFNEIVEEKSNFKRFLILSTEVFFIGLGIFLGLLASDANEARKTRDYELSTLISLRTDLNSTKNEIADDLEKHQNAVKYGYKFLNELEKQNPQQDSVSYYFDMLSEDYQNFPVNSTYLSLVSNGTDLISNDFLRNSLIQTYEFHIHRVEIHGRLNPEYSIHEALFPYRKKHFTISDIPDTSFKNTISFGVQIVNKNEAKSLDLLKQDTEFLMELDDTFRMRDYKINNHRNAIEAIDSLIELIDIEVN